MKWLSGIVSFFSGGIPTGWLIAGAVVASLALLGGVWKAGYDFAEAEGRAAALELENKRLGEVLAEEARQRLANNAIAANDATRAAIAEGELRDLRKRLLDTPAADSNDTGGLSLPRVERVRNFRGNSAVVPRKRPANPARHSGVFARPVRPASP